MKHISRIYLMGLLLLVVNQSPIFAQSGCSLLDKSKPLLFISFERGVEGKNRDIRLRLNNNSTCTIVVDTYEEPPKQTLAELLHDSSVCKPSKFLELQNGAHVGMFYNVQFPKQNLTQAFGASDVITAATLQSGHSILFDVPLKSFKEGGVLKLHFQYDWEVCNVAQEKYVIMHHEIWFFPWFIPKEML